MASTTNFLVALILAFISFVLYRLYFGPLSQIPGPRIAALSRLWLVYHSRRGDMNRTMISLHQKYGPLVRTGPNEVSISDLGAIKTIYGAGTRFKKSDWYSVWQGHRKFDLFAERDDRLHGQQRRLISRIYAMDSLRELEGCVDIAISKFMSCMDDLKDQVVDMGLWVQLFAFDVIGEVTFSRPFGFMDMGKDDGSFEAIEMALKSAAWIGQVPWLFWLNDWFTPLLGNRLGIGARHGRLRSLAAEEIEQRKERGTDRKDILEQLTKVHQEKPAEMDEAAVLSMATSNIFAGSDTTAISLRSVIYHLCKHPEYKQRLRQEIDNAYKAGTLSNQMQLKEAEQLPLLQAVLKESLRIWPAVGMALPRTTPPEGIQVNGKFIPGETIVGCNPWVIHRDYTVFGEDSETFRPDRWLKNDTSQMERYFFAFGAGARMCLGRNLSWLEMSKLVPSLLMNYDFDLEEPDAEWHETCWWFVKQEGLRLKIHPREKA